MTKVTDIFPPRWLRPEHLRSKAHRVAIDAVTVEDLFNPRSRQHEKKIVLTFHDKGLRLPLNKTQAFALASITGQVEVEQWVGHEVILSPGLAPNKAPTIVIARIPAPPRPQADNEPDDPDNQGGSDAPDDEPQTASEAAPSSSSSPL